MPPKRRYWDQIADIKAVRNDCDAGRLVIGSSDTVFGLLATFSLTGSLLLDRVKGRSNKPYIVLISDLKQVLPLLVQEQVDRYHRLIAACWPGPVTLIFPLTPAAAQELGQDSLAIRMPAHAGLRCLLEDGPLYSTSANKAGHVIPEGIDQVDPDIICQASCVIVDPLNPRESEQPSAILDCRGEQIVVIRSREPLVTELKQQFKNLFA
jgi:L-threonylcarbamoyladenylate synthase